MRKLGDDEALTDRETDYRLGYYQGAAAVINALAGLLEHERSARLKGWIDIPLRNWKLGLGGEIVPPDIPNLDLPHQRAAKGKQTEG